MVNSSFIKLVILNQSILYYLAKSEKVTGLSSLSKTIELPSTGDSTIPTIRRFCSQGALLFSRTDAKRATHFDFPCLKELKTYFSNQTMFFYYGTNPWKHEEVVINHCSPTIVASHTWKPFLYNATCQGQSPCKADEVPPSFLNKPQTWSNSKERLKKIFWRIPGNRFWFYMCRPSSTF